MSKPYQNVIAVVAALLFATSAIAGAVAPALAGPAGITAA